MFTPGKLLCAFTGIIDAARGRSAQSKLLPVNGSRVVVAAEPLEDDSRKSRRSADIFISPAWLSIE
jgi:hypothetical protein